MTVASYWLAKNEGGLPSYLLWQWRHNDVHTCCCQEVHHNHNCCGNTTHYLLLPGDSPHPQLPWQYNTLPAVASRFNTPTIAVATQHTTCCCQEVHHTHNWCSNTMDFLLLPLGSPHPQLLWQHSTLPAVARRFTTPTIAVATNLLIVLPAAAKTSTVWKKKK